MPGKHAALSPSSAERWMGCPASTLHPQGEEEYNDYSDEGTCAHSVAASCLELGRHAADYVGTHIEVGEFRTWEFTADMVEPTQRYVDAVRDQASTGGHTGAIAVEQAVRLDWVTGERDATGTTDALLLVDGGEELQVHDLKFGRGHPVSAVQNKQMMIYALAAITGGTLTVEQVRALKRVRLFIHQPRIAHAAQEWLVPDGRLHEFLTEVGAAVTRTRDVNPAYVPSDDACRWCPAKASCQALRDHVKAVIFAGDTDTPEQLAAAQPHLPAPGEEFPHWLAAAMVAAPLIEKWLKAVRAETERQLLTGREVPGWKLVQGKAGNRKWADEARVAELLKKWRLKNEVIYDMSLISPTKAQEVLPEKRYEQLQSYITRSEGGPSVAPASDKRPALQLRVTAAMLDEPATPAIEDIL
jgi:hypothetical protein